MFLVTGPVTIKTSACRGEATKTDAEAFEGRRIALLSAMSSSSQPLHEPASTSRSKGSCRAGLSRGAIEPAAEASPGPRRRPPGRGFGDRPFRARPSDQLAWWTWRLSENQGPEYEQLNDLLQSGKIRNDVAFDRRPSSGPLKRRWVAQSDSGDSPIGAQAQPETRISPPETFDERRCLGLACRRWHSAAEFALLRQAIEESAR